MTETRERPTAPGTVAASSEPDQLLALLGKARTATGDARQEIAGRIIVLLRSMRSPGHEASEAAAVLSALEQKRFHGLVDLEGNDCRKEAVETLLACGFPHALEVSPEDLTHARRPAVRAADPDPEKTEKPTLFRLAALAAFAGAGWQIYSGLLGFRSTPAPSFVLLCGGTLIGLGGLALLGLKVREPLSSAWGFIGGALAFQLALWLSREWTHSLELMGLTVLCAVLGLLGSQPKR